MTQFWLSPLGVMTLTAILAAALINIYARFIDDSLLDRVINSAIALSTIVAMLHVINGEAPESVTAPLIMLMAARKVTSVVTKIHNHCKAKNNACNHH